jgi:hypothetical protein
VSLSSAYTNELAVVRALREASRPLTAVQLVPVTGLKLYHVVDALMLAAQGGSGRHPLVYRCQGRRWAAAPGCAEPPRPREPEPLPRVATSPLDMKEAMGRGGVASMALRRSCNACSVIYSPASMGIHQKTGPCSGAGWKDAS